MISLPDAIDLQFLVQVLLTGAVSVLLWSESRRLYQYLRRGRVNPDAPLDQNQVQAERQRTFNEKCCIRCCSSFSGLFTKKLLCHTCRFFVCSQCSIWDPRRRCWTCKVCLEGDTSLRNGSPGPPDWLLQGLQQRCTKTFSSARSLRYTASKQDSDSDSGYDPSVAPSSLSGHSSHRRRRSFVDVRQACEANGEIQLSPTELQIREHLETLVEHLICNSLENASLDRLYRHPEYERIIHLYHGRLRECLTELHVSLLMAIHNEPIPADQTPSCAHASVKEVLQFVVKEAMLLPHMEEGDSSMPSLTNSVSTDEDLEELEKKSYEDILATAIINKIIEHYQHSLHEGAYPELTLQIRPLCISPAQFNGSLSDKEVQTDRDDDVDDCLRGGSSQEASEEESSSLDTESADDDFSWARGIGSSKSLAAFTIEEQIEEITTTVDESDSEEEESRRVKEKSRKCVESNTFTIRPPREHLPDLEDMYLGYEYVETNRVPFPELGVDLVTSDLPDDDCDPENLLAPDHVESREYFDPVSTRLTTVEDWTENWLFRNKRAATISPFRNVGSLIIGEESIAMLVPNPEEEIKPKVGSRDIDELSEMAENKSDSSIEFDSSSDEDDNMSTSSVDTQEQTAGGTLALHQLTDIPKKSQPHFAPRRQPPKTDRHSSSQKLDHITELRPPISRRSSESDNFRFVPVINRTEPPPDMKFVLAPSECNIPSGIAARFHCRVESPKPYRICWFFGCESLSHGGRFQMYSLEDDHYLEIYDTISDDSGRYSCLLAGFTKQAWADFKLNVRGASRSQSSPEIIQQLFDTHVAESGTAKFVCKVRGCPEPRLSWIRNGMVVQRGPGCDIERHGQGVFALVLKDVTKQDSGEVTVVATNCVGEVKSTACLYVGSSDTIEETQHPIQTTSDQTPIHPSNPERCEDKRNVDVEYVLRTWAEREAGVHGSLMQKYSRDDLERNRRNGVHSAGDKTETERKLLNTVQSENIPDDEHNLKLADNHLTKINCGLKEIDPSRYQRDYYVNNGNRDSKKRWVVKTAPPLIPALFPAISRKTLSSVGLNEDIGENEDFERRTPSRCLNGGLFTKQNGEDMDRKSTGVLDVEEEICNERRNSEQQAEPDRPIIVANGDTPKHEVQQRISRPLHRRSSDVASMAAIALRRRGSASAIWNQEGDLELPSVKQLASKFSTLPHPIPAARLAAPPQRSQSFNRLPQKDRPIFLSSSDFGLTSENVRNAAEIDEKPALIDSRAYSTSHLEHIPSEEAEAPSSDEGSANIKRVSSVDDIEIWPPSVKQMRRRFSEDVLKADVAVPSAPASSSSRLTSLPQSVKPYPPKAECVPNVEAPQEQRVTVTSLTQSPHCTSPVIIPAVKRVHSLTARSLSREFREAAKRNTPRILNRNVSVVAEAVTDTQSTTGSVLSQDGDSSDYLTKESDLKRPVLNPSDRYSESSLCHHPRQLKLAFSEGSPPSSITTDDGTHYCGYVSDDSSGISMRSAPPLIGHRGEKLKRKPNPVILSRAAFWDKRVQEGIVSDKGLAEEFPPM